jgi:hypothetical protein
MSEQQPRAGQQTDEELTPQQEDEALQQAARREAATREQPATEDQVFDSANEGGMGAGRGNRGSGNAG